MSQTRPFDEDQIFIRFPESVVPLVKPGSKIEIFPLNNPEEDPYRYYKVVVIDREFIGILLDLPCIIESQRTLDYINYFKSQDICQMLYVIPEYEVQNYRDPSNIKLDSSLSKMLITGERYKAKSGVTPGTQNITSTFFRREINENPDEVRRVETLIKEVMDNRAVKVVAEELIELEDGQPIPSNYEEIWDPSKMPFEE